MSNQKIVGPFDGEFAWLSNFFPCKLEFEGLTFDNSEAAFQAAKCLNPIERTKFVGLAAGKSKRLGKKVELRPDWNDIRIDVMREVLRAKFGQNKDLAEKLVATGDAELIEFNNWRDSFWGVCNGKGQNNLGKLLMQVRKEI